MKLEVKEIVSHARGTLHGVKIADVQEPMILITDYYPTVRYGTLDYFVVVIPNNTEIIERKTSWGKILYLPALKKKVVISYGDAATPDRASIEDMTDIDFQEIEELRRAERILNDP